MELTNECGRFITDDNGILIKHLCAEGLVTDIRPGFSNGAYVTGTYAQLIIPDGVSGFAEDFYRGCIVAGKFILPDSITSIGTYFNICSDSSYHFEAASVFAETDLPDVVLPKHLVELGMFAFGRSRIKSLWVPCHLESVYARQFKDAEIGILYLPDRYKGDDGRLAFEESIYDEEKSCWTHHRGYLRNFVVHCTIAKTVFYNGDSRTDVY